MLREFFEYADEFRCRGVYDITEIVDGFYRHELSEYLAENGDKASLFLRKFVKITMQFVDKDPRYQKRITEYAEVSS